MTTPLLFRSLALGSALLAASCISKSVDLTVTGDPDSLATIEQQVIQLAVDDERVYWLGVFGTGSPLAVTLNSCDKENCAFSRVQYSSGQIDTSAGFGVRDGQVYWFQGSTTEGPVRTRLVACPRAGCEGEPRSVSEEYLDASPALSTEAVFDDNFAYFCRYGDFSADNISSLAGQSIVRVPLTGQSAATEVIAPTGNVESMTSQGEYLYWLGVAASETPTSGLGNSSHSIQRVRKDGTGAPELVASDLQWVPPPGPQPSPHVGLTTDDSYVYWSKNSALGSISRCPLAGCTGEPEAVLAPTPFPLGLLRDGPTLYWIYRGDAFSYSIADCAVTDCQPSLGMVHGATAANALTTDDQYLYTAVTTTPFGDDDQFENIETTLRRISK